jgi:hypothetical protein
VEAQQIFQRDPKTQPGAAEEAVFELGFHAASKGGRRI